MHLTTALDELTEAELLDHAEEVSRVQRECEAQVLRIAVQHAIINNPETLDPEVARCPVASGPSASGESARPTSRSSPQQRSAPDSASRRARPTRSWPTPWT